MPSSAENDFKRAMQVLEDYGLLLVSDVKLPSVAGIVAGEPIRGSWWGHPKSHEIFRVNVKIEESGDAIVCKLLSGKQTFVHKRLWPALSAVGSSGQRWQTDGLSLPARQLLKTVRDGGEVRTDSLSSTRAVDAKAVNAAARELEQRLLVCCEEVHTESGAHAKVLSSWQEWRRRKGLHENQLECGYAKSQLEAALSAINSAFDSQGRLPWQSNRGSKKL